VRQLKLEGKFVAGYVGTHGLAHHLETLLDAAEKIRTLPNGAMFHFILLGDGARKAALKEEAMRRGLDNVTFIDSVPKDQVARYWSLLDVSVIHLKKTDLFTTVIPSKLFECMGMGLPVLHGVAGESADIVRDERVGIVFEPENADELVAHLRFLLEDRSAYEAFKVQSLEAAKKYDRKTMALKMLDVITQLAENEKPDWASQHNKIQ
ncbi:glycosyltransferase family 4 protein, partial [Nitrosomonas communis]|uniref:glycosyltransferase family 4 protein n=1 Tax=Nitrosomonas communis TaxID=44574 RepID=UPI0026EAB124